MSTTRSRLYPDGWTDDGTSRDPAKAQELLEGIQQLESETDNHVMKAKLAELGTLAESLIANAEKARSREHQWRKLTYVMRHWQRQALHAFPVLKGSLGDIEANQMRLQNDLDFTPTPANKILQSRNSRTRSFFPTPCIEKFM